MEVPFRLVRRETPAPADAALVFAAGFDRLAAVVRRDVPAVFPVRGGFLLVGPGDPPPGAVRLRRLRGDLLVPADADLVPALLPDEAVALTRNRGLVFLPGGTVLSFDPARPLAVADWLRPVAIRRDEWEPFPPRPVSVDRLTAIERSAPDIAVEDVLRAGEPDDADPLPGPGESEAGVPEDARPPGGSLAGRAAARAALATGGLLAWLGRQLGMGGLARAGANLVGRALERVPRLSEKLLGAQEAALRNLLRQLQSGDIEKALRRAPAAVPDPELRGRIGGNADLGRRDPRYSLRDLLGSGGGHAVAWLGGGDVWAQLAAEYRRLAAEAAARGDHRRAAYLYGVLLRDPRAAANALMAGGLFRDAAVLFRDRLKDDAAAAGAFDRAGDYDEAVRLYDRAQRWEAAGDLLKRIGDDRAALDRFTRTADEHAARGRWVAAGDVLRAKAARPELAAGYYGQGWDKDGAEAVPCGQRLLDEYLVGKSWPEVDRLLDAAEARFRPPRAGDAERFFHYARDVGAVFLPPDRRADLDDRVRLLFARHLAAATSNDRLFGPSGRWPGPVVRDATYAARGRPLPPPSPDLPRSVRIVDGTVTAAAVARDTGDVVVATPAAVMVWSVGNGRVHPVCGNAGQVVVGLSTDQAGSVVYVLRRAGDGFLLRCFLKRTGAWEPAGQMRLEVDNGDDWYLSPATSHTVQPRVTVVGPDGWHRLRGSHLVPEPEPSDDAHTRIPYLLAETPDGSAWEWDGLFVRWHPGDAARAVRWMPPWQPVRPETTTLAASPPDWLSPSPGLLEVCGFGPNNALYWSFFNGQNRADPRLRTCTAEHAGDGQYTAACLTDPARIAAATTKNEVHWLRATSGHGLAPYAAPTRLHLPARVVFLAPRPGADEVVAVLDDGSGVRLPLPGRPT